MNTNYEDVRDFHEKFGVPIRDTPQYLSEDEFSFRLDFMAEELSEFADAHGQKDLAGMADALVDLVYVVLGTALMMGLPWEDIWDEVQRANMAKMSAQSILEQMPEGTTYEDIGARHPSDVRKPEGWTPPNIEGILGIE